MFNNIIFFFIFCGKGTYRKVRYQPNQKRKQKHVTQPPSFNIKIKEWSELI